MISVIWTRFDIKLSETKSQCNEVTPNNWLLQFLNFESDNAICSEKEYLYAFNI